MQCKGKKSKETVWLVNTHAWWKLSMEEEEGVGGAMALNPMIQGGKKKN